MRGVIVGEGLVFVYFYGGWVCSIDFVMYIFYMGIERYFKINFFIDRIKF